MNKNESLREMLDSLRSQVTNERSPWEPVWRDVSDFIMPNRLRFHLTQQNQPNTSRLNGKIINPVGPQSLNILKSGMHSGITSPARPWFRLTTPDPEMAEFGPVSQWLHVVTNRMMTVFHRSNLYRILPTMYGDCAAFGTASATVHEDARDVIRISTDPIGSFKLACDDRGVVDTKVRELRLTVRQLVQKFGIDNVSKEVAGKYNNRNYETAVDVLHFTFPNPNFKADSPLPKFMRYASVWCELAKNEKSYLRYSGFNESPLLAPRWDVTGEDVYGRGLGMEAIGTSRSIQLAERRKAQAIDKKVNPPMIGDPSLQNARTSLLPGDITYVASATGLQGFRPAHEVNFDIRELMEDIEKKESDIRSIFFADLFLMLATSDRRNMTATEVAERHDEKLLMLGPVLERLNDELLNPLIDRTFAIMMRNGLIPEPPEELQGVDLKVEHISVMAQAQKMVSTSAVDRFSGFVGQLAGVSPDVLDNVDFDKMTHEYADMMGVSPNIVRSPDQVMELRRARAEAAAAAQQQEQAMQAAQGAKTLSEAKTDSGNALSEIMQQMGA